MNKSEQLAERYLTSLNLGKVVYEPDGNVPPDFAVGGSIAVEVRRLNQNHERGEGKTQGLEEIDIPLRHRIQKHLREFAPSRNGECWYVGYGFRRPVESWNVLRPLLDRALQEFCASPQGQRSKVKLTRHFSIDFLPASIDRGSFFVLGANMDYDSGGWVMAELERNARYGGYVDFDTVLLAPEAFQRRNLDEAALFGCFISHESVGHFIPLFHGAKGAA